MKSRELHNQETAVFEFEHPVEMPVTEVLRSAMDELRDRDIDGYIMAMFTACHAEDVSLYLTTLVVGLY